MKKLVIFLGLVALCVGFTGCHRYDDHYFISECIYSNNSSSEITMYVDRVNPYESGVSFIIPAGKSHILKFGDYPLSISHYLTVSDGEKIITQAYADIDDDFRSLYDRYNYIFVSQPDEHHEILLYIFDDSFFDNPEPLE